jgi:hypothetical protein
MNVFMGPAEPDGRVLGTLKGERSIARGCYSKQASSEPPWDRANSLVSAPGVIP